MCINGCLNMYATIAIVNAKENSAYNSIIAINTKQKIAKLWTTTIVIQYPYFFLKEGTSKEKINTNNAVKLPNITASDRKLLQKSEVREVNREDNQNPGAWSIEGGHPMDPATGLAGPP